MSRMFNARLRYRGMKRRRIRLRFSHTRLWNCGGAYHVVHKSFVNIVDGSDPVDGTRWSIIFSQVVYAYVQVDKK